MTRVRCEQAVEPDEVAAWTRNGIKPEVRERVFEPLFSTRPFGVGLGLPLGKQVMELHGGGVELQDVDPAGTRFTLWLPSGH